MARRTKEDALATRDSIIDAAEQLFAQQGVSRTTLQHIATATGVTRGAIYWHFDDKSALFNAMMVRAKMPLEAALQQLERNEEGDPLEALHDYALQVLRLVIDDPKARRAFEIATLKMEYVDEMSAVRERRMHNRDQWQATMGRLVRRGIAQGTIGKQVDPNVVALAWWTLIEGLIRNWLIAPDFDLVQVGGGIVGVYLGALRGEFRADSTETPAPPARRSRAKAALGGSL